MKAIVEWLTVVGVFFAGTAYAQEIITLPTRPGVTQSYFLAGVPKTRQAIVVLFPGSGGLIRLRKENDQIKFGAENFLVRSRSEFTKRTIVTAVSDAPSDKQTGYGMSDEFRLDEQHFADISAVVSDLNARFPRLPLFLVGTSRGSISAAALAARFGEQVRGGVLTSSMFRQTGRNSKEPGPGLSRFDFTTIKVPLLLVHHVSDQCDVSRYGEAQRLSDKYPLISVLGGLAAKSDACDPFSQHGFYGKESETIEEIVNWMLKKPFRNRID
jgi:hypothetical protein